VHIVIPEGAEFVQKPEHLDPLRRLGEVIIVPGMPKDKADLIARVKDADVVVLDCASSPSWGSASPAASTSTPPPGAGSW